MKQTHYFYFNKLNNEANQLMINLLTIILPLAAIIHFFVRYFIFSVHFWPTMSGSLFFLLACASIQLLRLYDFEEYIRTGVIILIVISTDIYFIVISAPYSGQTVWAVQFVFIAITLLYIHRLLLHIIFVIGLFTELYYLCTFSKVPVIVDYTDHLIRILLVVTLYTLAIYTNSIIKKRYIASQNEIYKSEKQTEEISALYEALQNSDEQLRLQNDELNDSRNTIQQLAFFDELTGLPKKYKFYQAINDSINSTQREDKQCFSIIQMSIESIQTIIDLHGHEVCDGFISSISDLLKEVVTNFNGRLFKVSNDFYVITPISTTLTISFELVSSIKNLFEKQIEYKNYAKQLNLCMGVSVYPEDGPNYHMLLKHSSMALDYARRESKGMFAFYSPLFEEALQKKHS